MSDIQENTIDFTAHIYESPHQDGYRTTVKCHPDFPGVIVIQYEDLDVTGKYTVIGEINCDKVLFDKISYAAEVIFSKTI